MKGSGGVPLIVRANFPLIDNHSGDVRGGDDMAWFPYAASACGLVFGAVGTVTGVISLRRTDALKNLELRIELGKNEAVLTQLLADTSTTLEEAELSQQNLQNVGLPRHAAAWLATFELDRASLRDVTVRSKARDGQRLIRKQKDLEADLVACHTDTLQIGALQQRYVRSIKEDQRHMHEHQSAIAAAFRDLRG